MLKANGPRSTQPLTQTFFDNSQPIQLPDKTKKVRLDINGQGTVSFNYKKFDPPTAKSGVEQATVLLKSNSFGKSLCVVVSNSDISLSGGESWRFNRVNLANLATMNLLYFGQPSKHMWVSVDINHHCIKVGHGYMLETNTLVRFEPKKEPQKEYIHNVIAGIEKIKLCDKWHLANNMKYWRLPVTRDPPALLGSGQTLADIEGVLTYQWLPMEAQRLYSTIRGDGVQLKDDDIAAINYSMMTKGSVLYEKLEQKERKSDVSLDRKTAYIRVALGTNIGDSVGEPFVLELWPIGSESAIHSHGDAAAIIKVLHGSIQVFFYNPLCSENNEELEPIKTITLNKGDITWMTPEFYQTHKLRNACDDTVTVTIQCYNFMGNDSSHSEHFDYISEIGAGFPLHRFRPRSDFDREDLLNKVQCEYHRYRCSLQSRRSFSRKGKLTLFQKK